MGGVMKATFIAGMGTYWLSNGNYYGPLSSVTSSSTAPALVFRKTGGIWIQNNTVAQCGFYVEPQLFK
ncbi:hypothetical protein [Hoylesella enoeca]|nr:hypothetical protein [Hoylesella enoeca]